MVERYLREGTMAMKIAGAEGDADVGEGQRRRSDYRG